MHRDRFVAAALMLACTVLARPVAEQSPQADIFALLRTVDEGAAKQAWPGFRLSDWPLAVFDGTRTLLARHPAPPPEFKPLDGRPGVFVAAGRHPAIGDPVVDLAGTKTVTIVATPEFNREHVLAECAEEMFHVFWLQRRSNFRPNEMARYAYPMKDVRNRQRVDAENEALARALEAPDAAQAAAWAATMLEVRRERQARLTPDDRAFETGMEMMEGIANAVARTVAGMMPSETARRLRLQMQRAAEELRWRYYDSGAAICLLLDRLAGSGWPPGAPAQDGSAQAPPPARDWKSRIDAEPGQTTTVALLADVVTRAAARPATFTAAELAALERHAAAAIADLSARQAKLRGDLLSRAGVRVVMDVAPGHDPLRVTRFDPLNLFVLDGGEVVHPRYLTLSGPDGTIEVTNADYSRGSFDGTVCLTRAAGRHPLDNGVRTLTLVGVKRPRAESGWDGVTVEADGVRIALKGATLERDAERILITVGVPPIACLAMQRAARRAAERDR